MDHPLSFSDNTDENGQTGLGAAHSQSIISYIQTHDMSDFEAGHPKTVQQWVLLGDPSLKIGGYCIDYFNYLITYVFLIYCRCCIPNYIIFEMDSV
jgi:hypothetical protein